MATCRKASKIGFPRGKYDDQVDSVSQFLKWAWSDSRRFKVGIVPPEIIDLEDPSPY